MADHYGFDLKTSWNKLPENVQTVILNGTGEEEIEFIYDDGLRRYEVTKTFEGVIPNLERRFRETESQWARDEISKYQSAAACPTCLGKRLRPEALAVRIAGLDIADASGFSIKEAGEWFAKVNDTLTPQSQEIAGRILKEINDRLIFLNAVGLDYLSMSRSSGTLSGGESQRIRLASQIGSWPDRCALCAR